MSNQERERELQALIAELMSTGRYDQAGARREAEALLPHLSAYTTAWDDWAQQQRAKVPPRKVDAA